MNKPLLIALMVICVVTILVTIYFLIMKITRRIGRLPIKGLITLLVLFVGLLILLFWMLTRDNSGSSGGGTDTQYAAGEDAPPEVSESDHIYLKNDRVWIDGVMVDADRLEEKINEYLRPRINNAVRVTIVDEYSSSELVKEVEAIFRKNNLEKDRGYFIDVKE